MDNQCNLNTACPKAGLTVQQPAQYNACKKKQQAPEEVDGCKLHVCSLCTANSNRSNTGLKEMPLGDKSIKA